MSQQDTEVVREATGAFNRGDPDAVLTHVSAKGVRRSPTTSRTQYLSTAFLAGADEE